MSHWHLKLVLQFPIGLFGLYLHHWCSQWLPLFAEFVNFIITTALCIYSIRSGVWLIVTTVLLLLSWTCVPTVSTAAKFSFRSHLRWSIRAFSPSHCQPLSRCPCRFSYCSIFSNPSLHTSCSIFVVRKVILTHILDQRFSNFFQVGTTSISQNVLRTTLLLGLSNSLGLP